MKSLSLAFITISVIMMAAGIALDVMVWLKMVAKDEPPLVVHLSTAALYFSGFGNIVTAVVNKQLKEQG